MYKLKLTVLQQRILRFLFINAGMSFTGRAIAKSLRVSQPGISKALPLLEKENLIKMRKDRDSKRLTIELNRENSLVIGLKRADNLSQVYESGLVDFLEDSFPGATVILFGSYSRGDDNISSDTDIAIIGAKEKEIKLDKYEQILNHKVNLNFYMSIKDVHKELRENLCNGIVLIGGVEI